jgi:CheY-like chemotaxis protein
LSIDGEIRFVEDGMELLDYLRKEGNYVIENKAPRPDLILLDLNMPRLNGLEVLRVIKSDLSLEGIPIMILTTSEAEEDVKLCLDNGACDFRTKPPGFSEWRDLIANSVQSHCPSR